MVGRNSRGCDGAAGANDRNTNWNCNLDQLLSLHGHMIALALQLRLAFKLIASPVLRDAVAKAPARTDLNKDSRVQSLAAIEMATQVCQMRINCTYCPLGQSKSQPLAGTPRIRICR